MSTVNLDIFDLYKKGTTERYFPRNRLQNSLLGFFGDTLKTIYQDFRLKLATLWSYDPINDKIILVASEGANINQIGNPIRSYNEYSCGDAISSRETRKFYLKGDHKRELLPADFIKDLGLEYMISIPILNTYNIKQVLLLLNVYPSWDLTTQQFNIFQQLGNAFARNFEIFLQDYCARFANRLNIEMGRIETRSPEKIFSLLAQFIKSSLDAHTVGIYIEKSEGQYLERECQVGDNIAPEDETKIDTFSHDCWKDNREKLYIKEGKDPIRIIHELLPIKYDFDEYKSGVFIPLRDLQGKARGVIHCWKSCLDTRRELFSPFTYESIAIVESIVQAFASQMEIILADYRRIVAFDKLGHEMRLPLTAFRAAVEKVARESIKQGIVLKHDYFEDIKSYCDVMKRLLFELDVIRKGPQAIPLEPVGTFLHKDIIAPATRFLEPLIKQNGFSIKQIVISDIIINVPELFLDRWLMTQVFFNLLENSIKHYIGNRNNFILVVTGQFSGFTYEIIFRDNGPGIPNGYEEKIFLQGVRGPNAHEYDISGEGFGLWFAREMVRLHGGDLILRSARNPTEFVVILPTSLKDKAPIGS
jgi:signal transduction histidine kinase